MKRFFGLALIIISSCLLCFSQEAKFPAEVSRSIETRLLTSKVFNNTRTIRVLLPPDYHHPKNKEKRYPVLYLTDGVMVFRRFNLEELVHGLINSGTVQPLIIVGIDNGASTDKTKNADLDRTNEFLPYPDVGFAPDRLYQPELPNPVGKYYPEFMTEVMKLVQQNYRIKSGIKNTGIGGFSYGGVAALYTAVNNSKAFGRLLLESTPLWIGVNKQLLKDIQHTKKWPAAIYIGSGTNESPDEVINKEGKALQDELIQSIKKNSPQTLIKLVIEAGAKHEAAAWSKRFPVALQFLFPQ
jgi:predicted alpha/beta superfamily hydrolase